MGRYLDLCSTVEVDAIEPAHPRDKSDISDQSPSVHEVPGVKRPVIEGSLGPSTSVEWTRHDWRDHYEERAAIIEHDGDLPRTEAERQALANTVNQWLVMHPPPATDEHDGCVHCNAGLGEDGVPVVAGGAHTWIHSRCHHAWLTERRRHAAEALRAVGIEAAGVLE